ncbi:MAG: pirin family protein [Deltaproteobacteria bacterium]|nr:pirin family protein [Deltaproteobacteria bacterium]
MKNPILSQRPLGFVWETSDPFLFCVHHDDKYPAGNAGMGPDAPLEGRELGQDFEPKDGWRMYHGTEVPGFPHHPHRGFETVTLVREGLIDHSDSLGATARFGAGDAQWLTAGGGIVHAEMFPLVRSDAPNPLELFQIWLNLPARNKMVDAHFSMLWNERIPRVTVKDAAGKATQLAIVAGQYGDAKAPPPPPKSWASSAESDLAIWTLKLEPGARFVLPAAASEKTVRTLYFFQGSTLTIAGERVGQSALIVDPRVELELIAGDQPVELLMLQGRPIGEPVVQYGPFVMNTRQEIQRAILDYQATQFGGWPWPDGAPVHPRGQGRFAKHANGKVEEPQP